VNFFLYSPISIKPWTPLDSETGIGGIETAITETARRLAQKGHDVTVYNDLPEESMEWEGVHWKHYNTANMDQVGVWVVYRIPEICTKINRESQVWFKAEDWDYPWNRDWVDCCDHILVLCNIHKQYILRKAPWLEDKILITSHGVKVDLIKELEANRPRRYCFDWGGSLESNKSLQEHARKVFAAGHEVFLIPALGAGSVHLYEELMDAYKIPYNKIYRVWDHGNPGDVPNGKVNYLKRLKADAFYDDLKENVEAAEAAGIKSTLIRPDTIINEEVSPAIRKGRNPRKLVYLSSPDRGLGTLLELMPRMREVVPDLELHVYYGFDNIDDLIRKGAWSNSVPIEQMKRLILETPGVVHHGRVTQRELYEELMSAGMMVYPTMFAELSFIAGMEAQCCGAIPVVTNVWAQGENTNIGIKINGDPSTTLVKAQFAAEICKLATSIDEQEDMRFKMIEEARKRCDWDRWVDQWIQVASAGPLYRKIWNCRVCKSESLQTVVDLGKQAIATFFPKKGVQIPKAPLEVVECQECHVAQLSVNLSRDYLFRGEYGYRSGINEVMSEHLKDVANSYFFRAESIVVDIGCNDGTFINHLPKNTLRLGFDPNDSNPMTSPDPNVKFVKDFFSKDLYMKITGGKKAVAIFSLAMFYDLEDPTSFAQQVWECLEDDGMWIIEVQDAEQLIQKFAFDFICHEHLTNWDYSNLNSFLRKNNFQVMDHEFNSVNGGSLIVTAKKTHTVLNSSASYVLPWAVFGRELEEKRKQFKEFLETLKPAKIWAYGASTKGNVLLQYYGLDYKDIVAVVDRNPAKHNRYTPGTNIPIVSEETCRQMKPDYLLALPWSFIEQFRYREPWARFITPFPEPAVFPPLGVAKAPKPKPEVGVVQGAK
jgi:NDP-4-keto-2,6-dideoxyhexose 3-C-methyltransferase